MAVRADSGWARSGCLVYGGVEGQGGVRVWGRRYPSVVDGDVGAGADSAGTYGRFVLDVCERAAAHQQRRRRDDAGVVDRDVGVRADGGGVSCRVASVHSLFGCVRLNAGGRALQ